MEHRFEKIEAYNNRSAISLLIETGQWFDATSTFEVPAAARSIELIDRVNLYESISDHGCGLTVSGDVLLTVEECCPDWFGEDVTDVASSFFFNDGLAVVSLVGTALLGWRYRYVWQFPDYLRENCDVEDVTDSLVTFSAALQQRVLAVAAPALSFVDGQVDYHAFCASVQKSYGLLDEAESATLQ